VSPPWLLPTMLGCLIFGLIWIVIFYVSQQTLPIGAIKAWNLVVGFAFVVTGLGLATRWR